MSDTTKLNIIRTIQYSNNPNEITYAVNQGINELGTLNFLAPYQNPDIPTRYTSPLIAAVLRGAPDLVQYLLENGADPNYAPGQVIGSPLDYAIFLQHDSIVDILTRAGGRPLRALNQSPSAMAYRQRILSYIPGGPGFQQARSRFYGGYH